MSNSKPSVCVVGAGMAGLVAIKECKHVGLDPVCYELNSDLGGIWTSDRDAKTSNTPRVWDSLITNTSKYIMTFSDYQCHPDTPQFMTWSALGQYYKSYARHFRLEEHIHYSTRVVKVRKTPDHDTTGRWEVFTCPTSEFHGGDKRAGLTVTDQDLARCRKEVFDFVLVCSGFFKLPLFPDIPGLDSFPGRVQHASDYKSFEPFKGQKVMVVGNSFSAGDIANDISLHTDQAVILSVGRGTWIWPRVMPGGVAIDRALSRKLLYGTPEQDVNNLLIAVSQMRLDHVGSGINPELPPLNAPYMLGDDIYLKILTDQIRIKDRLVRFDGSTAKFQSGTECTDLDAVVFATGYAADASFIDLEIILEKGRMELHNMMLPIREKHHTLGFIGFFAGDSPIAQPAELQARYMARLITKKLSPPSLVAMERNVAMLDSFTLTRKGKYCYFLPNFVLSDTIAAELGVYPSFWKILLRDPVLAYRVWYGPIFTAQYRLLGPDSDWATARAVCYKALQVVSATPSSKSLVKVKRDDIAAAKRRDMLWIACSISVVAVVGLVGRSRNWFDALTQWQ